MINSRTCGKGELAREGDRLLLGRVSSSHTHVASRASRAIIRISSDMIWMSSLDEEILKLLHMT